MTAANVTPLLPHAAPDDPPLFLEQLAKNKRRGKKVVKILAEFDQDEKDIIEQEAAADVDFGWHGGAA